jgi:hypothetical protein
MASTYSPDLRIELIGTGDQAGNWGSTTNTNLGTLIEKAIVGVAAVSVVSTPQALTAANGLADQARQATLVLTTTTTANFSVLAPPTPKQYVVYNNTAYVATLGNATAVNGTTPTGGATITVAAGKIASLWTDGTNFFGQNTVAGVGDVTLAGVQTLTNKTIAFADNTLTGVASTGANTFTGAQNTARATVASHATTADIWGAAGNQIDWTGTATTTIFPDAPQGGSERTLICAAACSFTAGANMLIDGVASAATVTCAANDKIIVRAITTTQFMLSRVKADGTAQVVAASGSLILISTITASAAASIDFRSSFSSAYGSYLIAGRSITADISMSLSARLAVGGAAVSTSTYNWFRQQISTGTYTTLGVSAQTSFQVCNLTNTTNQAASFHLYLYAPKNVDRFLFKSEGGGAIATVNSNSGVCTQGGTPSGVQLLHDGAGSISGVFKLYGILD